MQLDERQEIARLFLGEIEAVRVAADRANTLPDRQAAVTHDLERAVSQLADHGATARQSTLLVSEDDDLERVSRRNTVVVEQTDRLDRTDDADLAVVVAAARYGIDVRTEHDHGKTFIPALAPADDVAGGVDAHLEAQLAHQVHDVGAAGKVCLAVGDAADATLGICPEFGQGLDPLLHALRIGVYVWCLC